MILEKAIVHLKQLGLEVQSVVTDTGSNFIRLAKNWESQQTNSFSKSKIKKHFAMLIHHI